MSQEVEQEVEQLVPRFEARIEALESRVDQLQESQLDKSKGTPSCVKVNRDVSVTTCL